MCDGVADELNGIDLGDKRLDIRSKRVIEALASNPEASINSACNGWGDTLAAYRFMNNPSVTPERILAPHQAATASRIRQEPVVLILQDTTELDFTSHPPSNAGVLNTEARFGIYDHTHLAVTPDKLCLGVVDTEFIDRAAESLGKTLERKSLPIEQKESFRWLKGYRSACEIARQSPGTQIISIADSEADIYDIFVDSQQQEGVRAEYIIRAKEDRSTLERAPEAGPAVFVKVNDEVARSKVVTTRTIQLPQTPKRAARDAQVEVRAATVQVKPPHARSRLPSVTINVVLVKEVGGPGDSTDVSWLLMTTLPIATAQDVLKVVDYYLARWIVEIYFRTFKTGCRVEEIQLETLHRLKNCLIFYKIIAWRVLFLTYMNRTCPNVSCTAVFDDSEWKSVWRVVTKKTLPDSPPTLAEFMKHLTQLGGYNNRATELPPGPQTFWVGIRRMVDFAIAWQEFGPGT